MIIGWAKNMNATPDYVLYEMSFENAILYSAATPAYDDEKDDWDDELDANNPNNFKNKSNDSKEVYVR